MQEPIMLVFKVFCVVCYLLVIVPTCKADDGFRFSLHPVAGNQRLVTYFNVVSKPAGALSKIDCANICSQNDTCNVFSYEATNGTVSCRFGVNPKQSELNENSALFIKDMKASSDGFIHSVDGNSYKKFQVSVSSRAEAISFCNNISRGLSLPQLYPDDGLSHLQMMNLLGPGDAAYLLWVRPEFFPDRIFISINDNGTYLDGRNNTGDPNQHWQAGQPDALDSRSGAAIVMTTSGWDDVPLTTRVNTVICTRWTGYEDYNVNNGKFYHLVEDPMPTANAAARIALCEAENGKIALPYGPNMSTVFKYVTQTTGYLLFYVDGVRVTPGSPLWKFQDGSILDQRNKTWDARQSNWKAGEPTSTVNEDCMIGGCQETLGQMCDGYCYHAIAQYNIVPLLCERLY